MDQGHREAKQIFLETQGTPRFVGKTYVKKKQWRESLPQKMLCWWEGRVPSPATYSSSAAELAVETRDWGGGVSASLLRATDSNCQGRDFSGLPRTASGQPQRAVARGPMLAHSELLQAICRKLSNSPGLHAELGKKERGRQYSNPCEFSWAPTCTIERQM